MNYYLIDTAFSEDERLCILEKSPQPKEAAALKSQMMIGNPVAKDYPEDAAFHMTGDPGRLSLGGLVGNTMSLMIVQRGIKDLILSNDRAHALLECLPVSIFNHKKRLAGSDYFIINPLKPEDCLDLERSKIIRNQSGAVIKVEEFVLKRSKINPKRAVFRPMEDRYVYIAREDWLEKLDSLDLKFPNVSGTQVNVTG